MVNVGFVVEGECEMLLLKSKMFQDWANKHHLTVCNPIINAKGGGNLCQKNLSAFVQECFTKCKPSPHRIVILTDLECEPCVTATKSRIGTKNCSIVVARKAIESWYLADDQAMSHWLRHSVHIDAPEITAGKPWDYLKQLSQQYNVRGTGSSHPIFTKKMLKTFDFSIERAASHPNCPSVKYFLETLKKLGTST